MMMDTSFASVPDPFLLCLQFVFLPIIFGEQMVYYSHASVVVLLYIVVETYECVLLYVC